VIHMTCNDDPQSRNWFRTWYSTRLPVHKRRSVRTSNYSTSVHYAILQYISDDIVHACWVIRSSHQVTMVQRISFTVITLLCSMKREHSEFKSQTLE
jgi:hypothetical protein